MTTSIPKQINRSKLLIYSTLLKIIFTWHIFFGELSSHILTGKLYFFWNQLKKSKLPYAVAQCRSRRLRWSKPAEDPTDPVWRWFILNGPHGERFRWERRKVFPFWKGDQNKTKKLMPIFKQPCIGINSNQNMKSILLIITAFLLYHSCYWSKSKRNCLPACDIKSDWFCL